MSKSLDLLDEDIRDAVWNSLIPVKIDMAREDINNHNIPSSIYVIQITIYLFTNYTLHS